MMIRKSLKATGLLLPFVFVSQALAHPDFVPHTHPHTHHDYTSVLILSGVLGSVAIGFAMHRVLKRKKVKK